ncbi:succinate dehydrogenase, cytochrome b556 subunit [Actinomadura madurae]|uniref:succinate dehydrogenase, cytochrome b556 subunit n=1 Tax=Actinomadura madurae TaxID=1993 RepID=UPI0020273CDC|nr:succinate dehydrogenase, cytochrome b556 subunit [Actinomadura madurae]MCP9951352.1 succinate dehydrogenase, cytochrome b556 subunit [Actinomadura madurae]MCP9968126.1 succinate dehydrogenase, cytochrome b556 subunit [Actinomadura madurae]MCP9980585.1 succinate dehydrogenase, cytochrome b556 subunit [Actinomadura madurae]MCQ0016787.1 succinate dehydrogenase, cytochrome b556 subunit [Actinomadura madurae]URM96870.1 succinate dehydrogenase, cytochrome b556 subunit [Actinomadura madurae]
MIAQLVFLTGFTAVTAVIIAFTGMVAVGARRTDGGTHVGAFLRSRLARRSYDRAEGNRWAFYAHRVSGFAVFAFLALHILDVSAYAWSPRLYDDVHELYSTVPMRVFECGLLAALGFHALNGLRLVAIDLWDVGPVGAARLLDAVAGLTAVITLGGAVVIMWPVLAG